MPSNYLHRSDRASLIQAAGSNQREWLVRISLAAGGEVQHKDNVAWTYRPLPIEAATLAFPRFTDADAGEQIDAFLEFCRERRPIREIACWTEGAAQPWDLGARLVARGFNWGWHPHWMALDMEGRTLEAPAPEGVRIGEASEDAGWSSEEIWDDTRRRVPHLYEMARQRPQKVWVFTASVGNQVRGHCILNLTEGPHGAAGLYDVGVAGSLRKKGVGRALVLLACRTARDLGCRFAVLNSANDPFWLRLGFELVGHGQTWWLREESLKDETLRFPPPSPEEVEFVEAIGRGDVAKLEELGRGKTPEELNAPILGRFMKPMDLAIEMVQAASIEWLVKHGATPPQQEEE